MGLFRRRKETLNEQLLREAGLDPAEVLGDQQPTVPLGYRPEPEPDSSAPPPPRTGDITLGWLGNVESGTGNWDAVVTARAAGVVGNRAEFTTLPNGDVIVEQEKGDGDLSPFADAVEKKIEPPYRAAAGRQDGDLWAIGAKRIQVAKFELAEGDALELSENDGVQELRVDGEPSDAMVPELARLGERVGADYCVEATRIDGDFWEVKVTAL